MSRSEDATVVRVAVAVLRALRGWSQADFAAVASVAESTISRCESGAQMPTRSTFDRLVAASGVPPRLMEGLLSWLREALSTSPGTGVVEKPMNSVAATTELAGALARLAQVATSQSSDPGVTDPLSLPRTVGRCEAAKLWTLLEPFSSVDQLFLVEEATEYQRWELCELVCELSLAAASDQAERARELAALAVRIAELVAGEEAWRKRVQAYAIAHFANACRVAGELPSADEKLAHARSLWQASEAAPGLLSEARLFGLEAALRTSQRRLSEALLLLDRALASTNEGERKKLLLQRERVLNASGDFEGAIAVLRDTACLIFRDTEPRLYFGVRLNWTDNLLQAGRSEEANAFLPELRELAAQLDNALDTLRLRWLEGRLASGLGRREEAIQVLQGVREGFVARKIGYDAALASLELAVLYLEEGRASEVKALAGEMLWIFQVQGVGREAMAALKLFCESAEGEAVTVELARRVVEELRRGRG